MAVLDYLPKFTKGSCTGFRCIIAAKFFHENVSYVILYQLTKFQSHIFLPSRDIKQKVLLSSYLDKSDVINFKIYLEFSSKPIADREKLSEGKLQIQKFKYLVNENTICHNYLKTHSQI